MNELSKRYTTEQRVVIAAFFSKLTAVNNKSGRMLESKIARIMQSWEPYSPDIVISALEVYLNMDMRQAQGKSEKYVMGIISNKAAGGAAGGGHGNDEICSGRHSKTDTADEGERLRQLSGGRQPGAGELDCDF